MGYCSGGHGVFIKSNCYIGVFSVDITSGDEDAGAASNGNGFRVFLLCISRTWVNRVRKGRQFQSATTAILDIGSLQPFDVKGDPHSIFQRWKKWKREWWGKE